MVFSMITPLVQTHNDSAPRLFLRIGFENEYPRIQRTLKAAPEKATLIPAAKADTHLGQLTYPMPPDREVEAWIRHKRIAYAKAMQKMAANA